MSLPALGEKSSRGLHVRYEKAGLILDALPIPWNADAVIVEANLRLPPNLPHQKQEFTLKLANDATVFYAELLTRQAKEAPVRVFFRLPVLAQSCIAHVFWREHALGQIEIPIIAASAFELGVSLQNAALHAELGTHSVACRTFVQTQCQSLCASGILSAEGPLAPVMDLHLHIAISQHDQTIVEVPIHFTTSQLREKQALLAVFLPRLRRQGEYCVEWLLGKRSLDKQYVRSIARKTFQTSLRISATRFVVEKADGQVSMVRWLPHHENELLLEGITRVGPCFYVCTSEAGMAGITSFQIEAAPERAQATPMAIEEEMLVTDGPTPLLPGMLPAPQLRNIKHFVLRSGAATLGVLPLLPAPRADFTPEGGFAPLEDFLWSAAADEQLNDRLSKLLNNG